jgi:hypothetical protein
MLPNTVLVEPTTEPVRNRPNKPKAALELFEHSRLLAMSEQFANGRPNRVRQPVEMANSLFAIG